MIRSSSTSSLRLASVLLAVALLAPGRSSAQETGGDGATPIQQRPPILVTAQKQEQDVQDVPISMSVLTGEALEQAGVQWIHDAAGYVPNLTLQEFTARKLSFPFVRGIGSGPLNPSVTTYIDGVPQLNANSSSIELLDIGQVDFLRGTQGSLYGRNTLGGLVHIHTRRPDDTRTLRTSGSWGNYARQDYRVSLSGPLTPDESYFSIAGGYSRRDGFTKN
ncbi:MAG: TonB-dependent receptor plug domain-containing protein, partial [Phycisphaerae bacterium]|nr:TonB-dependent receptor plug domain-containing protein [Phycisphaerae bacterium]